jgi:hypothetical protein
MVIRDFVLLRRFLKIRGRKGKMAVVPTRICELVETFDRHIEAYRSQQYNETQLRREFIDPFFEELGWDVTNKAGYAQAYKDVIHEDAIKIGGATKASPTKRESSGKSTPPTNKSTSSSIISTA